MNFDFLLLLVKEVYTFFYPTTSEVLHELTDSWYLLYSM